MVPEKPSTAKDGDGLVPRESLAICEAWAQAEDPSLAAEIHEVG